MNDIYITFLMDNELHETEAIYNMQTALAQVGILADDGATEICMWSVKDGLLASR